MKDLEGLTSEMMSAFEGAESMEGLLGNLSGALGDAANSSDDDEEEDGRTATFPFLNKLMGNLANPDGEKKEDALPRCLSPGRGWRPQCPRGKNRAQKPDQAEIPGKSLYLPHPKSRRGKVGSDDWTGSGAGTGHSDPQPPPKKQSLPHRRTRRGKNRHCRRAGDENLQGDVPYKLKDKEVYLLDLTSLVAGTQFRRPV